MSGGRRIILGVASEERVSLKQVPLLGSALTFRGNGFVTMENIIGSRFNDMTCLARICCCEERTRTQPLDRKKLFMAGLRLSLSDIEKIGGWKIIGPLEFLQHRSELDDRSCISETRVMEAAELFNCPEGETPRMLQKRLERVADRVREKMLEFEQRVKKDGIEKWRECFMEAAESLPPQRAIDAKNSFNKVLELQGRAEEEKYVLVARLVRAVCDASLLYEDLNDASVPASDLSLNNQKASDEESHGMMLSMVYPYEYEEEVHVWDDEYLNKIVGKATADLRSRTVRTCPCDLR